MNVFRLSTFAVVVALAACATPPQVSESDRDALVDRIVKAQRLQEQFDQQLDQQREIMRGYATKMGEEATADGGGTLTPRQKEVLNRFMDQTANLFTGKELADRWKATYGKDLSTADLQQIVAYYESPLGQRDVASSKSTLTDWSSWMNTEGETRSGRLVEALMRDLQRVQP